MYSSSPKSESMKTLTVAAGVILSSLLVFQVLGLSQFLSIPSSGTIITIESKGVNSQIRGVLIGYALEHNPNWTTIANTLASYGVNLVDMSVLFNYKVAYPTVLGLPCSLSSPMNFTKAINAFHMNGIEVYVHYSVMLKAYNGDGISRNAWYLPYTGQISPGNYGAVQPYYDDSWLDIANPASWQLIQKEVHELVSNYTIDGIVFDYTRWDDTLMPLGDCSSEKAIENNYDRVKFIDDANLSDVVWPDDVVPVGNGGTGKYYDDFMEWRNTIIDELVQNITQEALSIRPSMEFGATTHFYSGGLGPAYWRVNQGQDFNAWVKQGSLDWVSPMMYSNTTSDKISAVQAIQQYGTGGAHGLVPIAPCITDYVYYDRTTDDVVRYVNAILSADCDGWMILEYAGPGTNNGEPIPTDEGDIPNIVPYLQALGLPNPATFVLGNITFEALSDTSQQISWITTKPTNSTIEYSSSPLYTWAWMWDSKNSFYYWQITHVNGTLIANSTQTTTHTVIITDITAPYYIHIMSGDPSGIATIYKFYTGG
jgi:hypothetical protein